MARQQIESDRSQGRFGIGFFILTPAAFSSQRIFICNTYRVFHRGLAYLALVMPTSPFISRKLNFSGHPHPPSPPPSLQNFEKQQGHQRWGGRDTSRPGRAHFEI